MQSFVLTIIIIIIIIIKLITSVISRRMQKYMDDENLIPKEEKGCYRGSKGCEDQLLISKAILQECKRKKKKFEYVMD
jgi:Na+-transporting methylmalonyl-CoA/oxaloacetate decarboxylase gamma subunit